MRYGQAGRIVSGATVCQTCDELAIHHWLWTGAIIKMLLW